MRIRSRRNAIKALEKTLADAVAADAELAKMQEECADEVCCSKRMRSL